MIWVDGVQASALPLPDRGLDFGDGLFETLLLQQGRLLYSELHLQRLRSGLRLLVFPECLAAVSEQLAVVQAQLQAWGWSSATVRLTLTRGQGPRGYAPPDDATPRIVISATRLDTDNGEMPAPAGLVTAQTRWGSQPQLAGIKHLNRLEQVLARREWQGDAYDEGLLCDYEGNLIEGTMNNLFIVTHQGDLVTPDLSFSGVAGVCREFIIEFARSRGMVVKEQAVSDLDVAEIFLCNSVNGVWPVIEYEGRVWDIGPVTTLIRDRVLEELNV